MSDELEQARIQLAACLTVAEGHGLRKPLNRKSWAWSVAYQRTLELRRKYDALLKENLRLKLKPPVPKDGPQ